MSFKPTIAVFGATGGCAGAALAQALRDGHKCIALARTPSKLFALMESLNMPPEDLDNLSVIQGSVTDEAAVRRTLVSPLDGSYLVDFIISGIGASPKLQKSLFHPVTLDNPNVCQQATSTILNSLQSLSSVEFVSSTQSGKKPIFITFSTTGISDRGNDVPLAFYGMYHWLLHVPHVDKRVMEKLLVEAPSTLNGDADAVIDDFVIIRASLLMDGESKGLNSVRVGWELPINSKTKQQAPGPAIGYTIRRNDVGRWVYERIVKGNGEWNGKMVTLTY